MRNKKLLLLPLIIILSIVFSSCAKSSVQIHDAPFQVHFIDVGQADSALVICDGRAMLIDGGNVADSSLLYSYLERRGIKHLDYTVCTHAHEDHVGGLSGALNFATTDVAYCPSTSYDSKAFSNFVKTLKKQGKSITVPKVDESFMLGGASVQFLGTDKKYDDANNGSLVLKITYEDVSFLFTGDIERGREANILDAEIDVSCTVLKLAHHGSDTSSTYRFLFEAQPEYAVISCGQDNSYGHPSDDVLSRLRDADIKTLRSDQNGTIVFTYKDDKLAITCEKTP